MKIFYGLMSMLVLLSWTVGAQSKYLRTEFTNSATKFDILVTTSAGSSTGKMIPAKTTAIAVPFITDTATSTVNATITIKSYMPGTTTIIDESSINLTLPQAVFSTLTSTNPLKIAVYFEGTHLMSVSGAKTANYVLKTSTPSFGYQVVAK